MRNLNLCKFLSHIYYNSHILHVNSKSSAIYTSSELSRFKWWTLYIYLVFQWTLRFIVLPKKKWLQLYFNQYLFLLPINIDVCLKRSQYPVNVHYLNNIWELLNKWVKFSRPNIVTPRKTLQIVCLNLQSQQNYQNTTWNTPMNDLALHLQHTGTAPKPLFCTAHFPNVYT